MIVQTRRKVETVTEANLTSSAITIRQGVLIDERYLSVMATNKQGEKGGVVL